MSSLAVSADSVICSVVCLGIGKAHSFCNLLIGREFLAPSEKGALSAYTDCTNTQKSLSANFICSCRFHNVVSFLTRKGCLMTRQKSGEGSRRRERLLLAGK